MSSDHQDPDGIPLPDSPLEEPAGGEVVSLMALTEIPHLCSPKFPR
jgi:hypothetical protein